MRIFADEGELIEKYRRLSDEGRARISSQIECELRIDAEVAAKRQESQRKGIDSWSGNRGQKGHDYLLLLSKEYWALTDRILVIAVLQVLQFALLASRRRF